MNLTTVATSPLHQMDGSNLPEAFLRGELNEAETNDVHKRPRLSSASPHTPHDSAMMDESETMNATSAPDGDTAQSADGIDRPNAHTTLAANAAHARGKKAAKPKATSRIMKYWTEEEETALHTALQTVGPKWAQIISLYGESGTVNRSLKRRDQVALINKASYVKKKMLENGEEVPAYLKDVGAKGTSKCKRTRRQSSDDDADEDRDGPAPRRRARPRRTTQITSIAAVKEEAAVIISDGEDGEDSKDWVALPSSTPKTRRKRQQPTDPTDEATDHQYQMMEIQLRQARAVREEAAAKREEAAARQREASIEREMLKMDHRRKGQR